MTNLRNDSVDFFLGATTPAGFKGYFEPLRHEPGMQMYLIKSGPGCGKSTLMKRLAQAAEQQGQPIEKIHCASDPDSLDGVVFLQKHAAILDATAPHVVEPDAPGADEIVVSLYHTIDAEKLAAHRDEVKALFARNAALRGRAARYIASAGSLMLDSRRAEALARGYHIITCPCAMHPEDQIDHLFIPALRLAFLTDNHWHPIHIPGVQAVRCTRFLDRENLAGFRARLRFNERAAAELLDQAVALMAQAKSCHDELETYYRASVDFEEVERLTKETEKRILSET